MYFHFDKNKYYVSAKKQPYISKEQVRRHNDFARKVEELTKKTAELSVIDERRKAVAGVFLCIVLLIAVCVIAINLHLEILIPFSLLLLGGLGSDIGESTCRP